MRKLLPLIAMSALVGAGLIYGYSVQSSRFQPQNPPKQQSKQEKRREASRAVFKGLRNAHSEKLDEVVAVATGDVRIEREIGLPVLTPHATFDLMTFLGKRACDADAIVIGWVTKGTSHLTEDGSFIYTAHDVKIADVLKDNAARALTAGQDISVFRSGGTIQLRGKRVIAEDKAAKSLEPGERYLLFLTYLPERAAYAADNLTYKLASEKIVKLTEQRLDPTLESGNDEKSFVGRVRIAAGAPCTMVGVGR